MIIDFFDTETTGLLKPAPAGLDEQPYIIEISIHRYDWRPDSIVHVDTFDELIKPPIPLSKKITAITGLTDMKLKDRPAFAEIRDALCAFMVGSEMLVAHNLDFDMGMLSNELLRSDALRRFPWAPRQICTVVCSMPIEQRRMNLGRLYEMATGKMHTKAHRAADDVTALVECFKFLVSSKLVNLD